jgi:hypothetical protein
MAHWIYLLAAAGPAGLAAWRYGPRAIVIVIGALTKDRERSKQCLEVLRLLRTDAKELPSYLVDPPGSSKPLTNGTPVTQRRRRHGGGKQPPRGSVDRIAS